MLSKKRYYIKKRRRYIQMKAHKYWSLGALAAMIGTFYTGYKNMKTAHKGFHGVWPQCGLLEQR